MSGLLPPCYCREDDDGFTVVLETSDCPLHHWEPVPYGR